MVVSFETMYAQVVLSEGYDSTEARRLSTVSYRDERAMENSFATQWRWMLKDDANKWMPFQPVSDYSNSLLVHKIVYRSVYFHVSV